MLVVAACEAREKCIFTLKWQKKYLEAEEMNSTKILFLYPPAGKQKEWELSLGLNYIEAYLKENGILAEQILPKGHITIDKLIELLVLKKPDILGFSCYDTNYYYVKLLAEGIKTIMPDVLIVVGGPTATFSWSTIMNDCLEIDICSIGEGEITTLEIIKEYYNGKKWGQIKGIVYRVGGQLVQTEPRPLVDNIDIFPSPYLSNISVELNERIVVLTSRGCIYNCTYCNCTIMCDKRVRFHSVERVMSELEYLSKKIGDKRKIVLIGDDAFTLNVERAKIICKEIIRRNIKLKLACETRADRVDSELFQLLKKAGFDKIDFGLESSTPRVLREIKKVFYPQTDTTFQSEKRFLDSIKEAVGTCKTIGLNPMVNIISGLPTETIEEAQDTIRYVKSLKIRNYSHNILRIYAGTELFNNFKKYGYKIRNSPFVLPYIVEHPIDITQISQLYNSINRHEIVYLKKQLKSLLEGERALSSSCIIFMGDGDKKDKLESIAKITNKMYINEDIFMFGNTSISTLIEYKVPSNRIIVINKKSYGFFVTNYNEQNISLQIYTLNDKRDPVPKGIDQVFWADIKSKDEIKLIVEGKKSNLFANPAVIVKNKCKFCSQKCLLVNDIRGVIDMDNNELQPCFTNSKIKLSDYKNVDIIAQKEYKDRGCENCIVKESCPKCIFPDPIDIKDYCYIMKNYNFKFNDYDVIAEYCNMFGLEEQVKSHLYSFRTLFNRPFSELTIER